MGCLGGPTPPVARDGKRTLLPMTMTCDWLKFFREAPVNLGTWEPDSIGKLSSYGAKAVSEVIVPPPLKNQHKIYEKLVSIRIKYKIL